jgi:hypothetical protein
MNPYEGVVRVVVFLLGAGGLMFTGAWLVERSMTDREAAVPTLFSLVCGAAMWWAAW